MQITSVLVRPAQGAVEIVLQHCLDAGEKAPNVGQLKKAAKECLAAALQKLEEGETSWGGHETKETVVRKDKLLVEEKKG